MQIIKQIADMSNIIYIIPILLLLVLVVVILSVMVVVIVVVVKYLRSTQLLLVRNWKLCLSS